MPAMVRKRDGKYRLVEPNGRLVKRNGTPVDGGGHTTLKKAMRQLRAINRGKR